MLSAQANHSSVAKRILAELLAHDRLISFLVLLDMIAV